LLLGVRATIRNGSVALAACLAALGASAGSAVALPQVPPGNSEVDQYVPTVPDSQGDNPLGGGGAGGGGSVLPHSTIDSLRAAGSDGRATAALADQTAPDAADRDGSGAITDGSQSNRAGSESVTTSSQDSVAGGLLDALGSGEEGGMGLLLPILLAAVTGAGLYALLRRRPWTNG
jgi:hypothetical protein